jgi:hypothetical protein
MTAEMARRCGRRSRRRDGRRGRVDRRRDTEGDIDAPCRFGRMERPANRRQSNILIRHIIAL